MVGGIVEAIKFKQDISTATVRGTGCERNDIYKVDIKTVFWTYQIKAGDEIWWQAGKVFWTPKNRKTISVLKRLGLKISDIVFKKVGYSYQ